MKLNLGCGTDIREGYVNVDFRKTHESVLEVDLSKFPWPFEDSSADEILMLDFLEHFPYAKTETILLECHRIIKDDGIVVIQVPDAEHLTRALVADGDYLCNRCGESMWEPAPSNPRHGDNPVQHTKCPRCGQDAADISEAAMMRLYGGQDYVGNFHHTCFTEQSLTRITRKCGLFWLRAEEKAHQFANWNFKAVFTRGDIW